MPRPALVVGEGAADRVARDRMVRDHYEPLLAFALRLARNESEARDLVHDAFERALRRYGTMGPANNERAWLCSILHNVFLDSCRRRATRRSLGDEALETSIAEPPPSRPPPWALVSAEDLSRAIDGLEPEFRDAYRMHAIEDRSYKEIAHALAIPTNTVGTRLSRARQKLRALLVALTGAEEEAP